MARRTAAGEPGSTKIALRPTVPAVARLIIAAEPIVVEADHPEQLAEAVEPLLEQGGDRLERRVRALMPVPPVVMITWVPASASRSSRKSDLRRLVADDGVSRDGVSGGLEQFANGAAARVGGSVRVSLTVTTKQATDAGARALCSPELTQQPTQRTSSKISACFSGFSRA